MNFKRAFKNWCAYKWLVIKETPLFAKLAVVSVILLFLSIILAFVGVFTTRFDVTTHTWVSSVPFAVGMVPFLGCLCCLGLSGVIYYRPVVVKKYRDWLRKWSEAKP
jgi:hypothetical protein